MTDTHRTPSLPRISPHAARPTGIVVQPNSADEIDRLLVSVPLRLRRGLWKQVGERAARQRMNTAGFIRTLIERELETPAP
jgi:hypothetical protein